MSIGSGGIFRWKAHVFSLDDLSGGARRVRRSGQGGAPAAQRGRVTLTLPLSGAGSIRLSRR